ncbi:RagB/SusD family nutrient uptake outer membrane protein [Ferruginibacter sp.]
MKKLVIITGMVILIASCKKNDFLDNKSTAITEEAVFKDSLLTIQFLNGIYNQIGFTFNKGRWDTHGNTEHSVDDGEYSLSATYRPDVILYNGTVSPTNFGTTSPTLADSWSVPYTNIRRCNLLMEKLPSTPLSAAKQSRMKGEAKCLRVWYYMQLLICYGGVPNVADNVYDIDAQLNLPRQKFADLVTYLSKELDDAITLLPAPGAYEAIDYGRVTKGTCLGLKSRLLLYAASPLFNGGANTGNASADQIAAASYPSYDAARWQAAADAALAVINSNYYSLISDNSTVAGLGFYKTFLTRVNPELIFALYRPTNKDFEQYYLPMGSNYTRPTHNLAAAFPMANGKAITDPTSGYDPTNPYVNRDPRFRYTLIYNGAKYANTSLVQVPFYTYTGSTTTTTYSSYISPTGYYCRKMCDSTVTNSAGASPDREWPIMRYAEILLNYAEAINETGQTNLAYPKLIELRNRAGITPGADGLYGMKANMTQAEMRDFIQNERRIELAFEDHRWNDIRRWKIAMTLYGGTPTGYNSIMTVTRVGTAGNLSTGVGLTFNYVISTTTSKHTFRPEMYLLPIQDVEIRKMPAMLQNPGW